MIKAFLSLLFLGTMYSCQKSTVAPSEAVITPAASGTVFNVNKSSMLQLVNAVRTAGCTCGTTRMPAVAAVTWNDQLAQAAYNHSKDMFTQDYFSHTSPGGTEPGARITAAGYIWRTYGENIALGYTSEQSVVDGWVASEGHCKNIMNANFREMGAGREGGYWTQEFGAK